MEDSAGQNQEFESSDKEQYDGENEDGKPRDIFCQMDVLRPYNDDVIWKESRRWVKFEEVLEEKGKRWSKPHVSSLTMQSLSELQMALATSPCLLDVDASSMYDVVDLMLERWRKEGLLENMLWNHVRAVLLKRHKHQHIHRKQVKRHESKRQINDQLTLLSDDEAVSCPNLLEKGEGYQMSNPNLADSNISTQTISTSCSVAELKTTMDHFSFGGEENRKFKRKIPEGAEVLNVMIGEVEELSYRLGAVVRLQKAKNVGNITEVSLPTRFIFILLVPKKQLEGAVEIGRCMGTLMTDQIFRDVAYKCTSKVDLVAAVQDFASHVTVLPPGCWDPKIRLEPPTNIPAQESSRSSVKEIVIEMDEEESDSHHDPTLERTGRLFGGLCNDVKRKLKWYKSDFTDCFHVQCLASFVYLFLATLTPNVTFGGLLGQATDNYMGTMECILAASITGVVFALFSGQPLNILGSTGPMLVLEMILYNFCKEYGWDFLPLRVWVGLWTSLLLFIIVAFDLSSLVRFITRFTEECFACLIAIIFIYQAVAKLFEIGHKAPVKLHPEGYPDDKCFCILNNGSVLHSFIGDRDTDSTTFTSLLENKTSVNISAEQHGFDQISIANCTQYGGILIGAGCDVVNEYVPDVFFFSVLLFIGTFIIAVGLVKSRNGSFFPNMVRQTLGDFSVLIAIVCMVGLDAALGLPTPKLTVPTEFKPTRSDRGWFINPVGDHNPWWIIPASLLPAILATILIFMDQQITSVIVNRTEHKLKKGGGYHLDLLVVAVLIVVCSILGLPWYVAATVTAIAHVMSLKKTSECTAPGEKPTFLGVREQRVTALLVGIFSGLAVLITSVLKYIPMPVLYGVFFYMGISALNGMQLFERILIMFMPQKYQPDYPYLRHVPLTRVHLFTGIQVLCLVLLWVVKSVKAISILFPIMVLGTCFIRKALDIFFCQYDLKWLDEILPSCRKSGNEDKKGEEQQPFTVEGYNKKKFMRSISVPASVHASQTKHPGLGSWFSNPVLHRTLSTDSIKAAISNSISGYVPRRKCSILSLPSHPTFLLDADESDDNHQRDGNFNIEDSNNS